MKSWLGAIALVTLLALPAAALPSKAPVVAFSIGPKDQAKPLIAELERQLKDSRRFVVAKSTAMFGIDQPTETVVGKLKKVVKADLVLAGTFNTSKDQGMELAGKLYNLATNDASKELRFRGTSSDLTGVARQLVLFLKSQNPLHGEITGMKDNLVLLNIGSEDGVEPGAVFTVSHQPGNPAFDRGTVRVVSTDAWFSTAEIVTRRHGSHFVPGDSALEDVGYSLIH